MLIPVILIDAGKMNMKYYTEQPSLKKYEKWRRETAIASIAKTLWNSGTV